MSKTIKLGNVIQKFSSAPLHLELLLFPDKIKDAKISAAQKKRHAEVYEQLFYAGNGKSYYDRIKGKTEYYKNKNGFYVLELPDTTSPDCEKDNTCRIQDDLGFKLGKAESNPTSAESGAVSAKSGGLYSRLMSYFIELGKNVRILHLRVFSSEDLNYYGKLQRAREYERVVKQELRKQRVKPLRGKEGSEYFKHLKPIKDAINEIDKYPNRFIGEILKDEKEGDERKPNVETRNMKKDTETQKTKMESKRRFIVLSQKYKTGREKIGAARGKVIKPESSNPNNKNWDVIFDDQAKKGTTKATLYLTFNPDLYNEKKEGGWVFESDENVLRDFKKAPKPLEKK